MSRATKELCAWLAVAFCLAFAGIRIGRDVMVERAAERQRVRNVEEGARVRAALLDRCAERERKREADYKWCVDDAIAKAGDADAGMAAAGECVMAPYADCYP